MTGNRYAIIIGVDTYKQKATWSQLPYVRGDVDGPDGIEHALMHDLGPSFVFQKDRIIKLSGFEATSDRIEKAFEKVSSKAGMEDLVLVYFSGHGIVHGHDLPVLATYETEWDRPHKTGVTFADVEDFAKSLRAQLVLIVDACFSGRILREKSSLRESLRNEEVNDIEGANEEAQMARERFKQLERLAVFASCQAEQVSRPGKGQTQSLFTQHFIAGLRGAGCALDGGEVTTKSLKSYLESIFIEETQKPAILIPGNQIITLSVPERPLGDILRITKDPWREYLATVCVRYRNSPLVSRGGFVDIEYDSCIVLNRPSHEQVQQANNIVSTLRGVVTKSKEPSLAVLLGDVGSGKTTLLKRLDFELAELWLEGDKTVPFPIWISLNDFRNVRLSDEISREQRSQEIIPPRSFRGIFIDILQYQYNLPIQWSTLPAECGEKPIVLIFDAFDEMFIETNREWLTASFRLLTWFLAKGAKIIVSCRTHFLRSDDELAEILQDAAPPQTEITIIKCQKFSPAQVERYIDSMSLTTDVASRCKKLVDKAFMGPSELARRPFLLEILVNSMPSKEPKAVISEGDIFEEFLNGWLGRDRWRFVRFLEDYKEAIERESAFDIGIDERGGGEDTELSKAEGRVREFIELLAEDLPLEKAAKVHYTEIPAKIRHRFPTLPEVFLNFFEYVIRTCSFLVRDSQGNYEFLHPSIQAYFAAWAILREVRRRRYGWDEEGRIKTVPKSLGRRLLDPKIREYICDMIDENDDDKLVSLARLDTTDNPNSLRYMTGNILSILRDYRKHNLSGLLLDKSLICDIDLSGTNLTKVDLTDCVIENVDFRDAIFDGTEIEGAQFVNVKLSGANLSGVKLRNGKTVVKNPTIDEYSLSKAPKIFQNVVSLSEKGDRDYHEPIVDTVEMKIIHGGRFWMGTDDPNAPDNERPAHEVEVADFWLDSHPVTNRQFGKFVKANPDWAKEPGIARTRNVYYLSLWSGDTPPTELMDHPVVYVSWFAAAAYADWAGKRLPTEAEWEYALRNNRHSHRLKYPWGNKYDDIPIELKKQLEQKPSQDIQELIKRHPNLVEKLGQKSTYKTPNDYANDYGLCDMSGNVNEFVQDWFDPEYWEKNKNKLMVNPTGSPYGQMKMLRGGSFLNHEPPALTCSYRRFLLPHNTNQDGGFRCARDAR